ncbi:unnamed protein product, partial [Discosporangium mesarthrocarpum]
VVKALSDVLAVAAGSLPPWVDALFSSFPSLLPLDLRVRYFQSLAFGVARSVAYLQRRQSVSGARAGGGGGGSGGGGEGNSRGGRGGGRGAGGVSRAQIVYHAELVMAKYSSSKAVLEFRFAGERGLGAGVTASFYSSVAAELQRRSGNNAVPMWVDNDSTGNPDGFLQHPNGLFPMPLPPLLEGDSSGSGSGSSGAAKQSKALIQRRRSVVGRFRFLGRLAGRCLMDEQVGEARV